MDSTTPNQTQTIDLNNLTKKQAVYIIWQLLNKAQSKGAFNIDEACAAKAAINVLDDEVSSKDSSNK